MPVIQVIQSLLVYDSQLKLLQGGVLGVLCLVPYIELLKFWDDALQIGGEVGVQLLVDFPVGAAWDRFVDQREDLLH